jgi:ABC-type polysaccharide/polyol phosphate transport system ATPase subunit
MLRIQLDDVSLIFTPRTRTHFSVKDWFLRRVFRRALPAHAVATVNALQAVSFEVQEGERLGVIGHNGAGKSTLLRVLAGVYTPSSGRRVVHGKIGSLFELTFGFETDATGHENIRYRCYLQKETARTTRRKHDEIAEFSELGPALNMPIRYYSSGMLVRLAFSIATAIEPEVLLVDEVLAAGDLAFQERARLRLHKLMKQARALVLVSHDLPSIPRMVDRVLWLDHGKVRMIGEPKETIQAYTTHMHEQASQAAA